jgi:hypothetical protein
LADRSKNKLKKPCEGYTSTVFAHFLSITKKLAAFQAIFTAGFMYATLQRFLPKNSSKKVGYIDGLKPLSANNQAFYVRNILDKK